MNLILACSLNGNQQTLLLVWALVPSENQENWEYFLNLLSEAYPLCSTEGFVIISDRDKGLLPTIEKILPNISHTKCCHYIQDNLVSKKITLFLKSVV